MMMVIRRARVRFPPVIEAHVHRTMRAGIVGEHRPERGVAADMSWRGSSESILIAFRSVD